MKTARPNPTRNPERQGLAVLLLVVLAIRAIIPAGFMPDLSALRDGRVEIVVCTPDGLKTLTVSRDAAGPPSGDETQPDAVTGDPCPFHTVFAQALALPEAPVVPVFWATASDRQGSDVAIRATVLLSGPPIGPRAPPTHVI